MKRKSRKLKLRVESLELRAMMTGNVTATVDSAGHLLVGGDSLDNTITITQTGTTTFVVTGNATTTVNGLATPATLPGVTNDFHIYMNDGIDSVQLSNLTAPKSVNIHLGNGADTFGATGVTVKAALRIDGEAGNDQISVSSSTVSRLLQITGGNNNDQITVNNVQVGKLLAINGGNNNDQITVTNSSSKYAIILEGAGTDAVTTNNDNFGTRFKIAKAAQRSAADQIFASYVRSYG